MRNLRLTVTVCFFISGSAFGQDPTSLGWGHWYACPAPANIVSIAEDLGSAGGMTCTHVTYSPGKPPLTFGHRVNGAHTVEHAQLACDVAGLELQRVGCPDPNIVGPPPLTVCGVTTDLCNHGHFCHSFDLCRRTRVTIPEACVGEHGPQHLSATKSLNLAPPGYYLSLDVSTPESTRDTLHDIIHNHNRVTYDSEMSWVVLELADEFPPDSGMILDIYRNSLLPISPSPRPYQREHVWPQSYGFPLSSGLGKYPRSDLHAIFLTDPGYNASRSNLPFDYCDDASCDERPTDMNNGAGGPGQSNWRIGSGSLGTWEVWPGRRGDVARALLYMWVRYDGTPHVDGSAEPELNLVDDRALIVSDSNANQSVAYMGVLSTLLEWHWQDLPDNVEFQHNEVVFQFQGNRSPFVDLPWIVRCLVDHCEIFSDGFESGDTMRWQAGPTGPNPLVN